MPTNVFTATYLLAQVKRYGNLARTGQGGLSDTDLIAMFNDEAMTHVTSLLKSARQKHLEVSEDIDFTANQVSIQIPTRAVANSLSSVLLLDPNGGQPYPISVLQGDRASNYASTGTQPEAVDPLGATLVLVPTPTSAGTLRLRYMQRLSRIVPEEESGLITAINTGTNTVSVETLPTAIVTGSICDLVRGTPPFDNPSIDLTAIVSGLDITFTALPSDLTVGDYVSLAGETPIPQVTPELHPLLAKRVALASQGGTGDPAAGALAKEVKDLTKAALELLTPRVTNSVQRIINPRGPGRFSRWRRF